jgi:hypothetical protein
MTNSYLVGLPFRIIRGREELTNVSDKDPTRDVVKFAVEQSTNILTSQRKKIAQLPDQCARSALALAKSQQALQVVDATTGILSFIRSRALRRLVAVPSSDHRGLPRRRWRAGLSYSWAGQGRNSEPDAGGPAWAERHGELSAASGGSESMNESVSRA